MSDMSEPSAAAMTATLLDVLAGCTAPATLPELFRRAHLTQPYDESAPWMLVTLLRPFGVLRVDPGLTPSEPEVMPVSPEAAYFLRSLGAYLRSGHTLLTNWERPGTAEPPYTDRQVLSGPQFLYLIEARRLALDSDAVPLRNTDVVQVVIKTRLRGLRRAHFLLLYDQTARQYQLPGGHVRAADGDLQTAAIRELEEELPGFIFDVDRDALTELGTQTISQLSRTHGAATQYRITLFQLDAGAHRLPFGPGARWVPEHKVLGHKPTFAGATLNVVALVRLAGTLPGGLASLPWSLHSAQRFPLRAVVVDHPWELTGLILAVIGILVSLIPLVG